MSPGNPSPAVTRLFACAANGTPWEPPAGSADDPAAGASWGADRTIPASAIIDLLFGGAGQAVHAKGIRISGARISGHLDLEAAHVNYPLAFKGCSFEQGLMLADARLRALNLEASHMPSITAPGASFDGDLVLDGVRTQAVQLTRARVAGALLARSTVIRGPGPIAFGGESLSVSGPVAFNLGFQAAGEVCLVGADLGELRCIEATCTAGETGIALNLRQAHVRGLVRLGARLTVEGSVDLTGAIVDRDVFVGGVRIEAPVALRADRLQAGGSLLFEGGVEALGTLQLVDAKVGGDVVLKGVKATAPVALNGYGMRVEESLRMASSEFAGVVDLRGATIRGRLEAASVTIAAAGGEAPAALDCERIEVRGDVVLRPEVTVDGGARFAAATIGGNLDCYGGAFDSADGVAFTIEGAQVGGQLTWGMLAHTPTGDVDFRGARVHLLRDSRNSWPEPPYQMFLDGFVFDGFSDERQWTPEERIDLLRAQQRKDRGFHPHAYDQLARVYASVGDEVSAQRVRVARQRDLRRFGNLSWPRWFASLLLDWSIEYGYAAWRPVLASLLMLLIGWGVFWSAGHSGAIQPKVAGEREEFSSFVYSVDAFIPVVNLSQDSHFVPNSERTIAILGADVDGGWVQRYRWVHKAAGLALSALVATAIAIQLRR